MNIIGISAFYHDSAAVILVNGELVAAAQEERFSRIKHDSQFPVRSIEFCLEEAQLSLTEIDLVVFYDKPFLTFERLLTTYIELVPRGVRSFRRALPVWLKSKLFMKQVIRKNLGKMGGGSLYQKKILFTEHHQSHAASAFYPSPFKESAVLCLDGVGEWSTTSVWVGRGRCLEPKWELSFPHSLGLLYSAFTYYCGFKVNSGEYKLMGLAPYGEPRYADLIRGKLIDIKPDGTFRLNMKYFDFPIGLKMVHRRFEELFGGPTRQPETEICQKFMDIAASIQVVIEEIIIKLAKHIRKELGLSKLCLAGGVALNCVANGKLKQAGIFDDIWIQPAAGDAGGALGAAYCGWFQYLNKDRTPDRQDSMKGSFLGPKFEAESVKAALEFKGASYVLMDSGSIYARVAKNLEEGQVVGWFQGRMEFGPRALGARSILGDARSGKMQSKLNMKIKFRESFRPFAPIILEESVSQYFKFEGCSPYMMFVADVCENQLCPFSEEDRKKMGMEKLNVPRSKIPAVTHVNGSARLQTVASDQNLRMYELLKKFEQLTGSPVLINTSFNVRGEPIVCSPEQAYDCFMKTDMDSLVIWPYYLEKRHQMKREKS